MTLDEQIMMNLRLCVIASLTGAVALATSGCGGSDASRLTVPPDTGTSAPSPRTFDLRFKGVGTLSDSVDLLHSDLFVSTGSALNQQFRSAAGTPLQLGVSTTCSTDQCVWFFDAFALPSDVVPVGVAYSGSIRERLGEALDTARATDTVITSMDIRTTPAVFGMSKAFTPQAGGYHLTDHVVSAADLATAAAAEGRQKRVITAVAFDSGAVRFLSYAWNHDTTEQGYDTQVVHAAQPDVPAAAQQLGANGYIVTAVGGNETTGFILVGTRVHGGTRPQPVFVDPAFDNIHSGYAIIASLVDELNNVTFVYQQ